MKSTASAVVGEPSFEELPRVSVLLVDDRPENLCALEASLEPLGQRLVTAMSGRDALRAVLDEQFAVILMDIRMPDLDGFETMALLKQRERSRDVPIIFLSAFPEQHNSLKSYSSGAVDYLPKPFDPDTLRSKVSVFVRLRQNELALRQAHDELERRVADRTAQLAAANRALEREIWERKQTEQRLFDLAHKDSLTGLANRALLMEHLNHRVALARRHQTSDLAVMMLDVDRFKIVNDSLGHLAGDQLLLEVARRLQRCLREADTAARLGGDEFAIVLEGVRDLAEAGRAAERVQLALSAPYMIDGKEVYTSASIGLVLMHPRYRRGEELLRDADAAMYRAKEAGRARYQIFDVEMHAAASSRLVLEADLRRVIERDELVIHYQPIVELAQNRVVGFEALLRWNHPQRGLLGPDTFIPLAEDTGMIRPIGTWVLETACRQLAAWRETLGTLAMSVNISSHQLVSGLAGDVERILVETNLAPGQLMIEITESALVTRRHDLDRLRALDVAIGLDDFGTGYSCLAYLHEFPVTALKIDRSFVQRIEERSEVVRAIVSLAHALEIQVTAEGVETAAQANCVRDLTCEHGQGYYFARPLTAADA
ncbi:MAG TPA: EAL domain-containing protein, partial [Kofleriaceae bacterium]|nr:EAL domain-containing protein [Kofleriaceae bacterium]